MSPEKSKGPKRRKLVKQDPRTNKAESEGTSTKRVKLECEFHVVEVEEANEQVQKTNTVAKRKKSVASKGRPSKDAIGIDLAKKKKKKDREKAKTIYNEDAQMEGNNAFPTIEHRGQPNVLVDALQSMNDVQKEAIKKLGFGRLFDLPRLFIPRRLCYWIVENYDARRGQIKMSEGEVLDVTEEDVEICLGLPRGRKEMVKLPSSNNPEVTSWREHIGKGGHIIRAVDVSKTMMSTKDTKTFQRDFIVLLYSCILEPHQSGATNQNLILPLSAMEDVQGYNWCGFVLKCLNDAKEKWVTNRKALFTGPLLFLTLLYIDRVVNYRRRDVNPRNFPAFIGWTSNKIMAREAFEMDRGGFGKGKIEPRQQVPNEDIRERANVDLRTTQEFNRSLGKDLRQLASITIRIANRINNIPYECRDNDTSKILIAATKALLGKNSILPQRVNEVGDGIVRAMSESQDPVWTGDELNKVVSEFKEAMMRRNDIIEFQWDNDRVNSGTELYNTRSRCGHDEVGSRARTETSSKTGGNDDVRTSEVMDEVIQGNQSFHNEDLQGVFDEVLTKEGILKGSEAQHNTGDVVNQVVHDHAQEHINVAPATQKAGALMGQSNADGASPKVNPVQKLTHLLVRVKEE